MTGLPGLEEMRSLNKPGLSLITLVFNDKTDVYFARQLVMERLLDDVSFDAARHEGQTVRIDDAYVDARLAALSQDEDLSRFIL